MKIAQHVYWMPVGFVNSVAGDLQGNPEPAGLRHFGRNLVGRRTTERDSSGCVSVCR
jgi:hypothetical protein